MCCAHIRLWTCLLTIRGQEYADMPLRDVVNSLAQNGIRMVYIPSAHLDAERLANIKY
jgi:hypothetical protein